MQVDAHTDFEDGWDEIVKSEWKRANNEFAVISTAPAPKAARHEYGEGGDKSGMVPRQCTVMFRDNGFPVRARVSLERFCWDVNGLAFSRIPSALFFSTRTSSPRRMRTPSTWRSPSCPTAGRPRSRLPSATWKKASPTIHSHSTPCRSNSSPATQGCGPGGE